MKNCPKCNAQISEDASFCNNCGNSLNDATSIDNNLSTSRNTKYSGGSTVFGVVLIVLVIILLSSRGGYKKPVENMVRLFNQKNTDVSAYLDCVAPSFVSNNYNTLLNDFKGDVKDEIEDRIDDRIVGILDRMEEYYGKDWSMSIKWKIVRKLSQKDLDVVRERWENITSQLKEADIDDENKYEELANTLETDFDSDLDTEQFAVDLDRIVDKLDNVNITAGYKADLNFLIKGSDGKDKVTCTIYIIKVNGEWIIDPTAVIHKAGVQDHSRLIVDLFSDPYTTTYLDNMPDYIHHVVDWFIIFW